MVVGLRRSAVRDEETQYRPDSSALIEKNNITLVVLRLRLSLTPAF